MKTIFRDSDFNQKKGSEGEIQRRLLQKPLGVLHSTRHYIAESSGRLAIPARRFFYLLLEFGRYYLLRHRSLLALTILGSLSLSSCDSPDLSINYDAPIVDNLKRALREQDYMAFQLGAEAVLRDEEEKVNDFIRQLMLRTIRAAKWKFLGYREGVLVFAVKNDAGEEAIAEFLISDSSTYYYPFIIDVYAGTKVKSADLFPSNLDRGERIEPASSGNWRCRPPKPNLHSPTFDSAI